MAQVRVLDYSPFDENLSLQVSGRDKPIVLGSRITQLIFVERK